MPDFLAILSPNRVVSSATARLIVLLQLAAFLLIWEFSAFALLPRPQDIYSAFVQLWMQEGLAQELFTSFMLNLQAIGIATALSLLMAYSTVLPFFRPMVAVVSKLRFLSMAGLTFIFTLATHGGHELKLSLLVFSVSVFFVTGMADVVDQVPKEKFDLARTLRMGEWRVVWEVIVLGRIDVAFDVMRQNAAIGFMLLTMVESMSRAEGGVGALLLNQNKHFRLDAVFAIQFTILGVGLFQDYAIGVLKNICCPYALLILERR